MKNGTLILSTNGDSMTPSWSSPRMTDRSGRNTGRPCTSPVPTVRDVMLTDVSTLVTVLNAFLPVRVVPLADDSTIVLPNSSVPVMVRTAVVVHAATTLRGTSATPSRAAAGSAAATVVLTEDTPAVVRSCDSM